MQVVLTDYPDKELIENLEYNVKKNIPAIAADRLSVIVRPCTLR
jgi:EEF1A N-terminal glycine/lysine methyltransferase